MGFTIETAAELYRNGAVITLTLEGEADATSAPLLDERIARAWHEHADLAVLRLDLTRLTHISSAGLRSLVVAHQRIGRAVGIVLTGVRPEVAELIRLTGFDRTAVLEETVWR